MADALLLRLQQRLASRPQPEPSPVPSLENPAFSELVQHVRLHYREPLQIRELAPLFHVSVSWCCLLFKRVFGKTFSEFVMELRLEEAARLLRKSGKTLQEIAGETGFHDYYHFIRCFSKRFGLPPSRFRKGQVP
jgi:two-component system response regulator YesN